MRKCKNGCCSFNDVWKDEDIYCAAKAPEEKPVVVGKTLNRECERKGDV